MSSIIWKIAQPRETGPGESSEERRMRTVCPHTPSKPKKEMGRSNLLMEPKIISREMDLLF